MTASRLQKFSTTLQLITKINNQFLNKLNDKNWRIMVTGFLNYFILIYSS